MGHSRFLVCVDFYAESIEKRKVTFFDSHTKKKFASGDVQYLHHVCAKRIQKLIENKTAQKI